MKYCHKDIIQNKGSVILSCIYSIFFISLMLGVIVIRNMIVNEKDQSNDILIRIFMENKLNQINYDNDYKFQSESYEICNDIYALYKYNKTFEFQNGRGTFKHVYTYYLDSNKNIVITNLEVYGE